jgi:hypothetical protein
VKDPTHLHNQTRIGFLEYTWNVRTLRRCLSYSQAACQFSAALGKTKDGFVKRLDLLELLDRRRIAPQRKEIRIAQKKRSKSNPLKS